MKKTLIQLTLLLSASYCQSQIVTSYIHEEYNNVNATISDGGSYFNLLPSDNLGYEVPKGSGNNYISSSSFWYGGLDVNSALKMSAQSFTPNGDIFSGPYSSNNSYLNPLYISKYSPSIWKVKKYDIAQHILNFASAGYVTPNSILNWPGNGDPTLGVSLQLAPFVDIDNDGIYEPTQGDYPDIKGCEASFIILNDAANIHTGSYGEPIGIEVRAMVYQYATGDYLNNTTFISQKVINRGTQTLFDFKTSYFMDADIGGSSDDYTGCDSVRNLMYTYNGDSNFQGSGFPPPCISAISLNNDLVNSGYFTNGASSAYSDPYNAAIFYRYMNGIWANGQPMTFGGSGHEFTSTTPCNFMFPSNPNDPTGWSEVLPNGPGSASNSVGDRRQYMTIDCGTFAPGDTLDLDFAILFAENTDTSNYLSCVNHLMVIADSVQAFYNSNIDICTDASAGINENSNPIDFKIYPNPSNGTFAIEFEKTMDEVSLEITDMSGRVVFSKTYNNQFEINIDLKEQAGMYVLKLQNKTEVSLYKLMVE